MYDKNWVEALVAAFLFFVTPSDHFRAQHTPARLGRTRLIRHRHFWRSVANGARGLTSETTRQSICNP
jgi:hypothetical protein